MRGLAAVAQEGPVDQWRQQQVQGPSTDGFLGLVSNSPVWIAVLSFVVAQLLKFLINYCETSNWQYERLVGSGGMPSAHSAFVTGLATAVAIRDGTSSSTFAIALVFALVVMYDATALRMACGRHAQVLNMLMTELPTDHPTHPTQFGRLKEQLGHTPLQVSAGALLGFLLALLIQGLLGPA